MACSKNPPDDRLKGWEVHAENMIRYGLKNGRVNLRDFNTAIEYLKEDDFPLAKIGELSCFLFELWKKLDNPPPPTPPSSQVGPPDDQGPRNGTSPQQAFSSRSTSDGGQTSQRGNHDQQDGTSWDGQLPELLPDEAVSRVSRVTHQRQNVDGSVSVGMTFPLKCKGRFSFIKGTYVEQHHLDVLENGQHKLVEFLWAPHGQKEFMSTWCFVLDMNREAELPSDVSVLFGSDYLSPEPPFPIPPPLERPKPIPTLGTGEGQQSSGRTQAAELLQPSTLVNRQSPRTMQPVQPHSQPQTLLRQYNPDPAVTVGAMIGSAVSEICQRTGMTFFNGQILPGADFNNIPLHGTGRHYPAAQQHLYMGHRQGNMFNYQPPQRPPQPYGAPHGGFSHQPSDPLATAGINPHCVDTGMVPLWGSPHIGPDPNLFQAPVPVPPNVRARQGPLIDVNHLSARSTSHPTSSNVTRQEGQYPLDANTRLFDSFNPINVDGQMNQSQLRPLSTLHQLGSMNQNSFPMHQHERGSSPNSSSSSPYQTAPTSVSGFPPAQPTFHHQQAGPNIVGHSRTPNPAMEPASINMSELEARTAAFQRLSLAERGHALRQ